MKKIKKNKENLQKNIDKKPNNSLIRWYLRYRMIINFLSVIDTPFLKNEVFSLTIISIIKPIRQVNINESSNNITFFS